MNYSSHIQRFLYYITPYWLKNCAATIYGYRLAQKRTEDTFKRYFAEISESQYWPFEKLRNDQLTKTRNFLLYAKHHSQYYRELFSRLGFEPEEMHSFSYMERLPILDKITLRQNMAAIISDETQKMGVLWSHTSGTTGLGLKFPESLESLQREFAFRIHAYSWGGVQWKKRWAWCAGHPVAFYDRKTPPFWVHDFANNWLLMSSYHLSKQNLPHYIEKLAKFKPELLAGYPSSLYLLARANSEMGKKVSLKALVTSSETLFESQRKTMEDSFGCKVFDYYGNGERAAVANQCEAGKYHLRTEYSYVEILDNQNRPVSAGQEGRLICTGFGNYATPLIRYDIGDVAMLAREGYCQCGREGIILDSIIGRVEDYIITPDGTHVGRLDHLFKDSVNIKMAQIVQDKKGEVLLRIVRESNYSEKDEKTILREARVRLGSAMKISVEYVESIERGAGNKFRFVVSRLSRNGLA